MKKYVFIANGFKPTKQERNSREKIKLTNYSLPCLEAANKMGYEIYYGVNRSKPEELNSDMDIKLYDEHIYRNLFDLRSNYIAYKNLMKLLKNEKIEVIHCNTPIGGLIGRICGKKAKVKKVIYTVHGFHFYKGAPLINRTLFMWAEKIMATWTDAIITMNQEDYKTAQTFKLKKDGHVYFINGVGIDTKTFSKKEFNKIKLRESVGCKGSDKVLISVGDLVKNKNHAMAIKTISELGKTDIHLLICGQGPELRSLEKLALELRVSNQIHFLGYRTDIKELLQISDAFLFTTFREGLPRSLMEAMASGLPCIVSKIRGNSDLIEDKKGGYLCNPYEVDEFKQAILDLVNNPDVQTKMSIFNMEKIKKYDIVEVKKEIIKIYENVLGS